MNKIYKLCGLTLISGLLLSNLSSCKKAENLIIIGTMQQPGEPILKHIQTEFEAKGYQLKIQLFTDFNMPNQALAEGSIDANLFQHEPFLNTYNEANHTTLFNAATLYDCVYGGYSKKKELLESNDPIVELKKIAQTKKVKVSIASDASNLSRCLFILANSGLIELKENVQVATLNDITTKPEKLEILPMATASIATSLDNEDTYLGIVNATFAIAAKLSNSQLICKEQDENHVNANILAVRSEDKNQTWLNDLVISLTSESTKKYIEETFNGTIVPYFVNHITE